MNPNSFSTVCFSPQPMRALPVDSQGDLLHSHSVSHKKIDYLTDNLGDLRLTGSANFKSSFLFLWTNSIPTQSQPKLAHQEDATYPQPGIRHIDRPRGYYNTDHRGHNYMSTDQREPISRSCSVYASGLQSRDSSYVWDL